MIKRDIMKEICIKNKNSIVISANGFISRDLYESYDKKSNFYMLGSMGLASSIALGIALKNPKRKIFVFDGDGNILMNLGSLVTIGSLKPKNLIHVIFDNNVHESTGGQPTNSNKVYIHEIAKASHYTVFNAKNETQLENILKKIRKIVGPIMIHVKIAKTNKIGKRVNIEPIDIKKRFMKSQL